MALKSSRNPYPFARYENDEDFAGQSSTQKDAYGIPTHLAQNQDPWNRLNATGTLTSSRREIYHYDPQAPNDSLDFILKAQYDHHSEFQKTSNEILFQPETLGLDHGRVLKNKIIEVPVEQPPLNHPLRVCVVPKRESIDSVKNAIAGHHTQTTNRGYSRKPDGGNYTG